MNNAVKILIIIILAALFGGWLLIHLTNMMEAAATSPPSPGLERFLYCDNHPCVCRCMAAGTGGKQFCEQRCVGES
jgi:hypothetical protein